MNDYRIFNFIFLFSLYIIFIFFTVILHISFNVFCFIYLRAKIISMCMKKFISQFPMFENQNSKINFSKFELQIISLENSSKTLLFL